LYVLLEAPFEGEHVFSSIRRVYEKKKREFFSLSPNDMQKIDETFAKEKAKKD